MKNINIFLDDERDPSYVEKILGGNYPNDWKIIRNYFDFVKFVDENFEKINLVSFDHDIQSFDKNGKEYTGKDAADYLVEKCLNTGNEFPNFIVHSANPVGKDNILGIIRNYLKHVEGKNYDFNRYHIGVVNNRLI